MSTKPCKLALHTVIESSEYKERSREYWFNVQNGSQQEDPTSAFNPLLSIYYLVDEMLKRKLACKKNTEAAADTAAAAVYFKILLFTAESYFSH